MSQYEKREKVQVRGVCIDNSQLARVSDKFYIQHIELIMDGENKIRKAFTIFLGCGMGDRITF